MQDGEGITLLEKEKVLQIIENIENSKLESVFRAQMAIAQKQIPQQALQFIVETETKKAFDMLFNTQGIEEEQV